ncbi:MAG TPA: hypothetical protein VLS48_01560 [Anaerolineales bacterium]|nr:hypothetical protein [Anaerolineales bacterium]
MIEGRPDFRSSIAGIVWRTTKIFSVLITAFLVLYIFFLTAHIGHNERAALPEMVYGAAHKPFVYRMLLPSLARMGTPGVSVRWVETIRAQPLFGDMLTALDADHYPQESFMVWLLMYGSLMGYWAAFRAFIRNYVTGWASRLIRFIGPWVVLLVSAPALLRLGYIYDLSQVFLFTLALLLMSRPEWLHFYLFTFAIANINKETSLLLIPVFGAYYWRRLPPKDFRELLVFQLLTGVGIKLAVVWMYRGNPGSVMENNLLLHWYTLTTGRAHALTLAALALVVGVGVGLHWRKKPVFLRTAFLVLAPLFTGLYFVGGWPGELRVFLEILPLTALLMATGWGRSAPSRA